MKISVRYCVLLLLLYSSVFYPFLERITGFFSWWDECAVVAFVLFVLTNTIRLPKTFCICSVCLFLFILSGLVNSLVYRYQPIFPVIEDIISFLKFPCSIGFSYLFFTGKELLVYGRKIGRHVTFISLVLFFLLLMNNFLNYYPVETANVPILRGEQLFYSHPTYLGGAAAFLITLLIIIPGEKRLPYLFLGIVMFATTRSKAVGWLLIVAFLAVIILKMHKKVSMGYIIAGGLALLLFAKDKIIKYFVTYKDAARGLLYSTSFKIFKDHFPLGSGFATFGSGASGKSYSILYTLYGMDTIIGFSNLENGPNFISDTFWPIIIAQNGLFGLIFYLCFVFFLFLRIQKLYSVNLNLYLCTMASLAYLLISSIAEASFVNCVAIPFGFIIGYALKQSRLRSAIACT